MLNPIYTLRLELRYVTSNDIINHTVWDTKNKFVKWCVTNAEPDADLDNVRALAVAAFKWWNCYP